MARKEIVNVDNYVREGGTTREPLYQITNFTSEEPCLVYIGEPWDAPSTALYVLKLIPRPIDGSGEDLPNARIWERQSDGTFKELVRED